MNNIGGDRGEGKEEGVGVEEVEVKIVVTLKRYQLYAWAGPIHLFPDVCTFLTMTLHKFMHVWPVGAPQ